MRTLCAIITHISKDNKVRTEKTMKIDFRIDWGYQYLYSRRQYHHTYIWDGALECEGGEILEAYQLEYPVVMYGPGLCAKETRLPAAEWKSKTKRGLSGVRFVADVQEGAVFHLRTASGCFDIKADELTEKGRIEFPVGPKYLGCFVTATVTDYLWFRQELKAGESAIEAEELGLEIHRWARMKLAWLKPESKVKFKMTVPDKKADLKEAVIHIVAMATPGEYNPEKETPVKENMSFELYCDGELVKEYTRFYREHDFVMQMLEDEWVRVPVSSGEHTFELKNKHSSCSLGISRIITSTAYRNHGQLSVPAWALVGERIIGKVFATKEENITVKSKSFSVDVECREGWNEFSFTAPSAKKLKISTQYDKTEIEIYSCPEEKNPIKVGYDMTVVPHDGNGFMDWLLDYTYRTRLGNYIVFRNFSSEAVIAPEHLNRWGEFCREHGIYIAACNTYMDGHLIKSSGEMFSDCGIHEYSGPTYALDPKAPRASETMKEASEKYIAYLKEAIDKIHTVSNRAAFGDPSGGIRYSFLAGADYVRVETMVGNTTPLLASARGATEALSDGRWGAHIAIQHHYMPYRSTHLGQYFLSVMIPWIMGADAIYEEDSLFCLFKEERQAWDDLLTKGKRDMTRSFFKFAKTHPREGNCVRNIAILEGRYAAPFNGFICGAEQDPHYSVWGAFGNSAVEWRHGQPEKCRQVYDVLMPGASTAPFRQDIDKRRFFFTGTPYGDFDCIPAEANGEYYKNYKLLVNLGWNTMIDEDYEKIKSFVENGGVLLTGITQFSTHTSRAFLNGMDDLALYKDGDLSELCGIKVLSRGDDFSGQWNTKDKGSLERPELCGMPSDSPEEDGRASLAEVEFAGAEIVAWDSANGKPLVVRNKVGNGYVYTLTIWAYPGHESFSKLSAVYLAKLAKEAREGSYVEDESGEVFWSRWVAGDTEYIKILNTDWTKKDNIKTVTLVSGSKRQTLDIKEGVLTVAEISNGRVEIQTYSL